MFTPYTAPMYGDQLLLLLDLALLGLYPATPAKTAHGAEAIAYGVSMIALVLGQVAS